jgi:hypothetical protein
MAGLVWLHEEALRADHPVFAAVPEATALFCWDVDYMAAADIGLRRQIFIYESLLELDVTIIRGAASQVLPLVARRDQATQLYVPNTPNPLIRQELSKVTAALAGIAVELVSDRPFVQLAETPDLGRFFRYWNKARKQALRRGGV